MKVQRGEWLRGPAGLATELLCTVEPGDPPAWAAGVAQWFLECPRQSPAWDHYMLGVVHLRPVEGAEPAAITVPHATHEVLLWAMDPERGPRPDDASTWTPLTPLNVVEQLQLPNDHAARGLLRQAAEAVVAGLLWAEPPLSGQVEPWRTTLIKTSAHWRGEAHAP